MGELAERILGFIDYYDRHDAHPYEWTYTGKPLVSGDAPRKEKTGPPPAEDACEHEGTLIRRSCETQH